MNIFGSGSLFSSHSLKLRSYLDNIYMNDNYRKEEDKEEEGRREGRKERREAGRENGVGTDTSKHPSCWV